MAENENGQERTEQATPKRLQEAREKGQVPRSRELTTLAMLLIAALTLSSLGAGMVESLGDIVRLGLDVDRKVIFNPWGGIETLIEALTQAFFLLAPFLTIMVVAAIAAPLALGGWAFSTQAMAFKLEKLNPVSGLKRLFALRGLMELSKALAKFILIGSVGAALIWHFVPEFIGLGRESVSAAVAHAGSILAWSFVILSSTLILIAGVDVPFQLRDHANKLKMSHQEVKEEHKNIEGKPEVKSRVRTLQREIAQRRMMTEIPDADVVITNPSHYAIALRYNAGNMAAPVVVAKGVELLATQIRTIAVANDVPLFEAPPLARALYYSTELNAPVPAGLYLAVAQVLAYVYQLKTATKTGVTPEKPADLDVPDEFYQGRDKP